MNQARGTKLFENLDCLLCLFRTCLVELLKLLKHLVLLGTCQVILCLLVGFRPATFAKTINYGSATSASRAMRDEVSSNTTQRPTALEINNDLSTLFLANGMHATTRGHAISTNLASAFGVPRLPQTSALVERY